MTTTLKEVILLLLAKTTIRLSPFILLIISYSWIATKSWRISVTVHTALSTRQRTKKRGRSLRLRKWRENTRIGMSAWHYEKWSPSGKWIIQISWNSRKSSKWKTSWCWCSNMSIWIYIRCTWPTRRRKHRFLRKPSRKCCFK